MTYRAATHGLAHLGVPDHPTPSIYCDGCGMRMSAMKPNGQPYSWLLNNKAPKGWRLERTEEPFTRRDTCPRCIEDGKRRAMLSNGNGQETK